LWWKIVELSIFGSALRTDFGQRPPPPGLETQRHLELVLGLGLV
jgi:hypothetical protein